MTASVSTQQGDGEVERPRLGLSGIRERLRLVNGSLQLETSPGAGTTLFVQIPPPSERRRRRDPPSCCPGGRPSGRTRRGQGAVGGNGRLGGGRTCHERTGCAGADDCNGPRRGRGGHLHARPERHRTGQARGPGLPERLGWWHSPYTRTRPTCSRCSPPAHVVTCSSARPRRSWHGRFAPSRPAGCFWIRRSPAKPSPTPSFSALRT